jgi:hypothetical protein
MGLAGEASTVAWATVGRAAVALAVCAACSGGAVAQTRYVPPPEQVVLAPSSQALGAQAGPLREAERGWRRNPNDLAAAVRYARAAFVLGLNEGDLRWYGTAKAALLPWWTEPSLSAEGHFLRGLVKQGFHDFAGGLADFNASLALDADRAEVWSWRFALHLLQTDLAAARQDCASMAQRFGPDEGQACEATLMVRTGQAAQAVGVFERLVQLPGFQGDGAQRWLRFHQGQALWAAGQPARAQAVWTAHLQAQPRDHGARLALVELLNATGQPADARRWASVPNPTDALLVQQLLASQVLKDGTADRLTQAMVQRLAAREQRGEGLIERPEMVFFIRAAHDVPRGLKLAQDNWATQQEPVDGALLVEAALLLGQPEAARPVLDWVATTGYTDPVLQPLLAQVRQRLGGR